tara:strand:- start:185 stop:790 length:606 start_codon:yes stop_codon:yes gene_type:complete
MFTSRAEYRLTLRADNADSRLTQIGIEYGVVSLKRKKAFTIKSKNLSVAKEIIKSLKISPNQLLKHNIKINMDGKQRGVEDLLSYKNINIDNLKNIWPKLKKIDKTTMETIEIESHYKGYLQRQSDDIESFKKDENLVFPNNFDFNKVGSLSNEILEKLNKINPPTLGAASRISGVTPPAIIALLKHVKRKNKHPDGQRKK